MEIINLNLIPGKAWPVAHATQFDKGREFRANLFEGSQVYTLAGDETVDAIIKKPDGNQVIKTLVNTADNYVIVTTTEQMTAVAGPSLGEIRITKGDTVIGSLKFILECEQSADTGIESHSEINNLETQVAAIVADQYDAGDVIFDNTPTAGHGVGFAVTSEGVLNAIPTELDDLDDVNISGAAQGEALVWNGAEWVNGTVSTVGSIDDLNDVDTTGKANADSLRYNATAQEWEAKPTTVEMTLAEYEALGGDYSGYENTNIIITDAPNLNATAQEISYDGGADTVWDKVEAVDSKATSGAVTITPASGISIIGQSNYINDKSVGLSFYMEKTGGWSTGWNVVGTVDKKPSVNVYCPLWNVTNGGGNGMCRIDADGTINFYLTTGGGIRLNANLTYRTA